MTRRNTPPKCPIGHHIDAATAFHDAPDDSPCPCGCKPVRHFLWGHSCPADGRYWIACHRCGDLASGADHTEAIAKVGGYL